MTIRQEAPQDYKMLYTLVKRAFETARVADGDEQDFMERLRRGPNYIPELALVAEQEGELVGHIMLTKTAVENGAGSHEVLLLAPLSVLPAWQGMGVGSGLVREALARASAMGWPAVFLAGDPGYYNRFGFVPASRFGIRCGAEVPQLLQDHIMALELKERGLENVSGIVRLE